MPFEQDINGVAANALVRNRTHNISLPVEPPGSTGNVSPSPVDQIQEQNHANTVRISVLRESLRPITLKVCNSPVSLSSISPKRLNY